MTLTLDLAQRLIRAAVEAGGQQKVPVAVAVVDKGGQVIASARSEASGFINLEVAVKKAVAAVNFSAPTHAILDMIKGDDLLMRSITAEPSLSVLPGGAPVMIDGHLSGAIGVAGGHYTQDQAIAEQALAGLA